jgi:hypothetical protein
MIDQPQALAVVVDVACKRPKLPGAGRFRHDDISPGVEDRAGGKRIADSIDAPAGDIDLDPQLVKQLHPLPGLAGAGGIILNFIKRDDRISRRPASGGRAGEQQQDRQK